MAGEALHQRGSQVFLASAVGDHVGACGFVQLFADIGDPAIHGTNVGTGIQHRLHYRRAAAGNRPPEQFLTIVMKIRISAVVQQELGDGKIVTLECSEKSRWRWHGWRVAGLEPNHRDLRIGVSAVIKQDRDHRQLAEMCRRIQGLLTP